MRTLYRRDDLAGPLPLGAAGVAGAAVRELHARVHAGPGHAACTAARVTDAHARGRRPATCTARATPNWWMPVRAGVLLARPGRHAGAGARLRAAALLPAAPRTAIRSTPTRSAPRASSPTTPTTCSSRRRATPWATGSPRGSATSTRPAAGAPRARLPRAAAGAGDGPQPQPVGGGLRRARHGRRHRGDGQAGGVAGPRRPADRGVPRRPDRVADRPVPGRSAGAARRGAARRRDHPHRLRPDRLPAGPAPAQQPRGRPRRSPARRTPATRSRRTACGSRRASPTPTASAARSRRRCRPSRDRRRCATPAAASSWARTGSRR